MSTAQGTKFVEVYLFFNGRCDEALEFYKKSIDAQVLAVMRHNESPEPPLPGMLPEGFENKVMHTVFQVGKTQIMASDGCSVEQGQFNGFKLAITTADEAEADRYFAALSEGGKVEMPLAKTFWSPKFGMVTDKFGVPWMISMPHD